MTTISLVAARSVEGVIGVGGRLPWHLPSDLARFKALTMGHAVIMGRVTFQSLGRPLPGRRNIVITRDPAFSAHGATVVLSPKEALAAAGQGEVFVIGGAAVFREMLPLADRLYLTVVQGHFEGDTHFPALDERQWREVSREDHDADERNPHAHSFLVLERRKERCNEG